MKTCNSWLLIILLMLKATTVFASASDGRWHLGIGDPTVSGWITVLVYLLAIYSTYRQIAISRKEGNSAKFWLIMTFGLVFLAINKQLDLQSWLTEVLRDSAYAHGWYAYRRALQLAFIVFLGLGMLLVLMGLRAFLANSWKTYKMTWVGLVLLCTFILMRAASFHHFDIFINTHLLGLRVNVILEMGALLLIILGTFYYKKTEYPITVITKVLKSYVEVVAEGDTVNCPQCATEALFKAVDARVFKCKACGYKYTVRVVRR
jgi:hypothetical protein